MTYTVRGSKMNVTKNPMKQNGFTYDVDATSLTF
jgi:hypothetical protein